MSPGSNTKVLPIDITTPVEATLFSTSNLLFTELSPAFRSLLAVSHTAEAQITVVSAYIHQPPRHYLPSVLVYTPLICVDICFFLSVIDLLEHTRPGQVWRTSARSITSLRRCLDWTSCWGKVSHPRRRLWPCSFLTTTTARRSRSWKGRGFRT